MCQMFKLKGKWKVYLISGGEVTLARIEEEDISIVLLYFLKLIGVPA